MTKAEMTKAEMTKPHEQGTEVGNVRPSRGDAQ